MSLVNSMTCLACYKFFFKVSNDLIQIGFYYIAPPYWAAGLASNTLGKHHVSVESYNKKILENHVI
jgi:hypothetical protein